MTTDSLPYVPFSQRSGIAPPPPQLKLGEASDQMRRLIYYSLHKDISTSTITPYSYAIFVGRWERMALDVHVHFFKFDPDKFENSSYKFEKILKEVIYKIPYHGLFDLTEFFVRHPLCGSSLKADLVDVFVSTRAAYRIINDQVVAIGTEEQGAAFDRAIADAEASGAGSPRSHLVASGAALRNGDWAGSVRESIHAVEAAARRLAPEASTVGPALKALEKRGYLNGRLKDAFEKLYAYTNAEEGVRHARVFEDESKVDEADALFMLGACASFVSYLLARSGKDNSPG